MTLLACISLIVVALGVACAIAAQSFRHAPGWRRFRLFQLLSLSAAGWVLGDVPLSLEVSAEVVAGFARVQFFCGMLHVALWFGFIADQLGRPLTGMERAAIWILAGFGFSSFLGQAIIRDGMVVRSIPWMGITYRDPNPAPFGTFAVVVSLLMLVWQWAILFRAWRRRVPESGFLLIGSSLVLFTGFLDNLTVLQLTQLPYMLAFGFAADICAVGIVAARRFVSDAGALDELSRHLEHAVKERTQELEQAREALIRAEKLAALGQVVAGVAHELNNPTAAAMANVRYVLRELRQSGLPPDAAETLEQTHHSLERVANIVRQLLEAGRSAGSAQAPLERIDAMDVMEKSLAVLRASRSSLPNVDIHVPLDLKPHGNRALLEQVFINLLANAMDAVEGRGAAGRIQVRADGHDNRVLLSVSDNGHGMTADVLRKIFDPFFTTKPVGRGTGLGLAVSLGLVRSMSGDIRVQSVPGEGTRFTVELPTGLRAQRTSDGSTAGQSPPR